MTARTLNHLLIKDSVVWFKHIESITLRRRLEALAPEQEIILEADGEIGRWQRMKTGVDGRESYGIRPVGQMKEIWNNWFKTRKGDAISLGIVTLADDYLAATSELFREWSDPADEAAFRDL